MGYEGFDSFFMAGFECSSQRRPDGVRLDLIRATAHDLHELNDYSQCKQLGFRTIRDGLRWHLIEKAPGKYDWSSWMPALEAAEQVGMQVIWDLFHYGSPEHVDQSAADFPNRFTDFATAAIARGSAQTAFHPASNAANPEIIKMSRQPRASVGDYVLLAIVGLVTAYAVWLTLVG
jgi:hypothetical protein